jgi:hypothetical protein
MTRHQRQAWLDRLALGYQEALERGDDELQAKLWELALEHPDLVAAFEEVQDAVLKSQRLGETSGIAQALACTMPSARIEQTAEGAPTLGEIAREILNSSAGKLDAEGHRWLSQLHDNPTPVPELKGLSKLRSWLETQFGPAPPRAAEACQTALQDLRLRRRAAEPEYRLAARKAKPPRPEGSE